MKSGSTFHINPQLLPPHPIACLPVSGPIEQECFIFPNGVGPRRGFIGPTFLGYGCTRLKGKPCIKISRGFILLALSVGLMKPQRGSTPVWAKMKTGGDQGIVIYWVGGKSKQIHISIVRQAIGE
jgi:hypothetical protein